MAKAEMPKSALTATLRAFRFLLSWVHAMFTCILTGQTRMWPYLPLGQGHPLSPLRCWQSCGKGHGWINPSLGRGTSSWGSSRSVLPSEWSWWTTLFYSRENWSLRQSFLCMCSVTEFSCDLSKFYWFHVHACCPSGFQRHLFLLWNVYSILGPHWVLCNLSKQCTFIICDLVYNVLFVVAFSSSYPDNAHSFPEYSGPLKASLLLLDFVGSSFSLLVSSTGAMSLLPVVRDLSFLGQAGDSSGRQRGRAAF